MIKAIVFDVDGTLVENVSSLTNGWKLFAKKMKLKPPTREQIKECLGIPYYEIAPQLWPGFNPYEHAEEFRKCVRETTKNNKPLLDRKALIKLKKKYKLGIVTSARKRSIEVYLEDIIDLFDSVVTADDTDKHKPDPAPMILCCQKLKIDPTEALFTGDTMFDFLCARGAGSQFVGVLTGVGTIKYFKKLNSPYIKSVKTIEKYTDDLNGKRSNRKTN